MVPDRRGSLQARDRSTVSPADLPHGAASAIGNHWESVGLPVRGGHLDRRLAYTSMSYEIQYDGATFAAFKRRRPTSRSGVPTGGAVA